MTTFLAVVLFAFSSFYSGAFAVQNLPDFRTHLFHGDATHSHLWAIEISPPAGHHFNLEAPRSAQQEKVTLDLVQESPERILFQTEHSNIHVGSVIEVSAFVCDEKKTYCMKKKMFVTLDEKNTTVITERFSKKKDAKIADLPMVKKEGDLFIDNDPTRAFMEAKKTGKPLLIDFYGIWCPPCNLYKETIFNTKEFAEAAKKYVLLKMDADDEKSFELKSKFKIGGYPTLLIAKVNAKATMEEVERIVGYFPPHEFYARLDKAYAHRNDSMEARWKGRLEDLLSSELEQKNYDEVIRLTDKSVEPSILLYRWTAQSKKNTDFLKDPKNLAQVKGTLQSIAKDVQKESSDTLAHAIDFLTDEFWLKQAEFKMATDSFIAQLETRIDPHTLFVKGTELTQADLDSVRMDIAETLNDDKTLTEVRKKAIHSYEKLIAFFANHGSKDLRSMNLEYAYLLWKDGQVDHAKKLYHQFIQKYPAEFTFYFAASKMYLTLKDYKDAREMAEKALKYSYGDNQIRAMERIVAVMAEQGLNADAVLRGNEYLKTVKAPQGLEVRTGRYIDALKTTIARAEKPATGTKQ